MKSIDKTSISLIGFDANKAKAMTDIVIKKKQQDQENDFINNLLPKTLENIFNKITEEINKGNNHCIYTLPAEAYKQQIIAKFLEDKNFKVEIYNKNSYIISW